MDQSSMTALTFGLPLDSLIKENYKVRVVVKNA